MKEIQLTQGKVALVNDEDFAAVAYTNWYADKHHNTYYAATFGNRRKIYMHRLLFPLFSECCHVDGNGLNNQRYNVTVLTHQQNMFSIRKVAKASSVYKGVSYRTDLDCIRWAAYIHFNYKKHHLGNFSSEIEAAIAYNGAAKILFGEHALLNSVSKRLDLLDTLGYKWKSLQT